MFAYLLPIYREDGHYAEAKPLCERYKISVSKCEIFKLVPRGLPGIELLEFHPFLELLVVLRVRELHVQNIPFERPF